MGKGSGESGVAGTGRGHQGERRCAAGKQWLLGAKDKGCQFKENYEVDRDGFERERLSQKRWRCL